MFDFVRKHTRLTLGFLLLLIIPSFIFFGIDGYRRSTEGGNETVAKVDGQSINRGEWDQAHQRNVERVRRQSPTTDVKLLDTPQAKRESLDVLIRQRVLLAAARDLHLSPTDARLQRLFVSDPQFASLRNPDGTVNRELLAAQGMSSDVFARQLRQDLAMQQVLSGVSATTVAPLPTVAAALDPFLQRREVQLLRIDPVALRARINPTDAEIEAFYKSNEATFRAPEQATIDYVVLDLAALGKGVTISEDELRKYYTENASRYTQAEERRASHILIKAEKDQSAADRSKAKARAEDLLQQVRKAPQAFAELARKNSDDTGSAARGGDLDFFGRGAMVKPFEDAAFSMKPGEISNLVESDFGFHIITLVATRGGQVQPFEAVRADIETEVRKALAQKKYAEAAEQFTNTVYEQPDSLQPVIDKLKLEKKTATVQRTPLPGATGPLASQKLLEAVFGNDAVRNKRNIDAVEIGPNQLASARIVQYSPARTLPLAEVKPAVRERLVADQAAALARKEGQAKLAELQKSPPGGEAIGPVTIISRAQGQGVPKAVLDAVLRADASKLPTVVGVDLGLQGYLVMRVTKILPREVPPGGDGPWQQQYAQIWAAAESEAYEGALKRRYKVDIKPAALAVLAEGGAASAPAAASGASR
jgi:peptidyl-prolyl cis-trans isomerase D